MPSFLRKARIEFSGISLPAITDLRVSFEIDKNDAQQFNHAAVRVWNLAQGARAALARPMPLDPDLRFVLANPIITVRLFAGYEGDERHLFSGDILWAHNNQVGPDWITQMELYADLASATIGISQVSFAGSTPATAVVSELLKSLNIGVRYTQAAAAIIAGKKINDYTASGRAHREADEFLKRYGLSFMLEENSQGLIYVPNSARDPEAPRSNNNTFSPENGLVGTPTITSSGIEIVSLLRPTIKLFNRFFVRSETTSGTLSDSNYAAEYFVVGLKHAGDTRGDDWHTQVTGSYARIAQDFLT